MDFNNTSNALNGRSFSRKFSTAILGLAIVIAGTTLSSQAQNENRWTASFGAGFTPLVGELSNRLNNGWHITFGGGVNATPHVALTLDYAYNGFGVNRSVLNEVHVPDGNSHIWSLTVNPKIRFSTSSALRPFIAGGIGYYRRTVEFTSPTVVPVFVFDPFFGTFFNTLVPADRVLGSITRGGIGGSLGGGFEFKVGSSGVKLYTEARYHYANTGRIITRMVPVTFGIRW